MPRADFFCKLGLFVRQGFLDEVECTRLCREMRTAPHEPAVVTDGRTYRVDKTSRQVLWLSMSEETQVAMTERLRFIIPDMEEHFGLKLKLNEPLQFLRYNSGDFFQPHADSNAGEESFDHVKERQVTIVAFLNDAAESVGINSYSGGALTMYGLIDGPGWQSKGFELQGETGLLIAFRSDLIHEVKPVIDGERYTIVTWLSECDSESAPESELSKVV